MFYSFNSTIITVTHRARRHLAPATIIQTLTCQFRYHDRSIILDWKKNRDSYRKKYVWKIVGWPSIEPTIVKILEKWSGGGSVSWVWGSRIRSDCYVKRRIPFSDLVCATPRDHSRDPWPSEDPTDPVDPCRCSCLIIPFNRSETRDTTFFQPQRNKSWSLKERIDPLTRSPIISLMISRDALINLREWILLNALDIDVCYNFTVSKNLRHFDEFRLVWMMKLFNQRP